LFNAVSGERPNPTERSRARELERPLPDWLVLDLELRGDARVIGRPDER
jgi:hypothetical protein